MPDRILPSVERFNKYRLIRLFHNDRHDQADHEDAQDRHANAVLQPEGVPVFGLGLVAGVVAFGWGSDPVVVIVVSDISVLPGVLDRDHVAVGHGVVATLGAQGPTIAGR